MKKILKLSNEEPKEYLKGFNSGKEYELTKKCMGVWMLVERLRYLRCV